MNSSSTYYKPAKFELYELYPKDFYEEWRHKPDILWQLWDERVLRTLQALRNNYGKMHMNNWMWGGDNQYKGYRPPGVKVGSELSQHKHFRAADPSPEDYTAEQIREDILTNPFAEEFKHITCVEMSITWVHFDVRNWNKEDFGVLKVYP